MNAQRQYCSQCLAFDGRLNRRVISTQLTNPATGKTYEGLVCAACLERDAITRVTCRTFVNAPVAPSTTRIDGSICQAASDKSESGATVIHPHPDKLS